MSSEVSHDAGVTSETLRDAPSGCVATDDGSAGSAGITATGSSTATSSIDESPSGMIVCVSSERVTSGAATGITAVRSEITESTSRVALRNASIEAKRLSRSRVRAWRTRSMNSGATPRARSARGSGSSCVMR